MKHFLSVFTFLVAIQVGYTQDAVLVNVFVDTLENKRFSYEIDVINKVALDSKSRLVLTTEALDKLNKKKVLGKSTVTKKQTSEFVFTRYTIVLNTLLELDQTWFYISTQSQFMEVDKSDKEDFFRMREQDVAAQKLLHERNKSLYNRLTFPKTPTLADYMNRVVFTYDNREWVLVKEEVIDTSKMHRFSFIDDQSYMIQSGDEEYLYLDSASASKARMFEYVESKSEAYLSVRFMSCGYGYDYLPLMFKNENEMQFKRWNRVLFFEPKRD